MKPRLTSGWTTVYLGSIFQVRGWYCSDGKCTKWGSTPKAAYAEWQKHVNGHNLDPAQWIQLPPVHQPQPRWWDVLIGHR